MKILAISGSYRENGVSEQAAKSILEGAESNGWETQFVALREKHIEFCRNCRNCGQRPGNEPGECVIQDDMNGLLRDCLGADLMVLSSPINFYESTAIFKRFLERLVPVAYWPWDSFSPKFRVTKTNKRAVLITSSAAPGLMVRFLLPHATDILKITAKTLNAKVVKKLYLGMAAKEVPVKLSDKEMERTFELGRKLTA